MDVPDHETPHNTATGASRVSVYFLPAPWSYTAVYQVRHLHFTQYSDKKFIEYLISIWGTHIDFETGCSSYSYIQWTQVGMASEDVESLLPGRAEHTQIKDSETKAREKNVPSSAASVPGLDLPLEVEELFNENVVLTFENPNDLKGLDHQPCHNKVNNHYS